MIKLYSWRDFPNFGDALSADVVEWISGERVQLVQSTESSKLLAVGSILQHARAGDVVWGSGIHPLAYETIWRNYKKDKLQLTVLAVRGPLTRDLLRGRGVDCPKIFGDPAILLPLFYPDKSTTKSGVVLIPHYSELKSAVEDAKGLDIKIINPSSDWRVIVDAIVGAASVISSSLHGLIVSEAYGVPAVWHRGSQGEGFIKYADYYLGTGRVPKPVDTLAEAYVTTPEPPPLLSDMQRQLCAAFHKADIQRLCGVDTAATESDPNA